MSNFCAYKRTNKHDTPTPTVEECEWVICRGAFVTGFAVRWPAHSEGERQAKAVADMLNAAYADGQNDVRREVRQALGIEDAE